MLRVWLISIVNSPILTISQQEKNWSKKMNKKRKLKYILSRSYLREMISLSLNINPIEVPLNAPPGKPPCLEGDKLGFVSISYSKDYILIAWSNISIGIDCEKLGRNFKGREIVKRYFSKNEILELENYKDDLFNERTLIFLVCKEAAKKCIRSNINNNIFDWEFCEKKNFVFNKKLKINLYTNNFILNNHFISIVNKSSSKFYFPIVCSEH